MIGKYPSFDTIRKSDFEVVIGTRRKELTRKAKEMEDAMMVTVQSSWLKETNLTTFFKEKVQALEGCETDLKLSSYFIGLEISRITATDKTPTDKSEMFTLSIHDSSTGGLGNNQGAPNGSNVGNPRSNQGASPQQIITPPEANANIRPDAQTSNLINLGFTPAVAETYRNFEEAQHASACSSQLPIGQGYDRTSRFFNFDTAPPGVPIPQLATPRQPINPVRHKLSDIIERTKPSASEIRQTLSSQPVNQAHLSSTMEPLHITNRDMSLVESSILLNKVKEKLHKLTGAQLLGVNQVEELMTRFYELKRLSEAPNLSHKEYELYRVDMRRILVTIKAMNDRVIWV